MSMWKSGQNSRAGCSRPEINDKYNEERWPSRFKTACFESPYEHGETCTTEPIQQIGPAERANHQAISRLVRLQYGANQLISVTPTVLLLGAYGAIAFSFLSLGPA